MAKMQRIVRQALREAGASRVLQDAASHMWCVDAEGKLVQWEMMDDTEWNAKLQQLVQVQAGDTQAVHTLMGQFAMVQPAIMRQQGWLSTEWTGALHAEGLSTKVASSLVKVVSECSDQLHCDMWRCRNDIVHGEDAVGHRSDLHRDEPDDGRHDHLQLWQDQDRPDGQEEGKDAIGPKDDRARAALALVARWPWHWTVLVTVRALDVVVLEPDL